MQWKDENNHKIIHKSSIINVPKYTSRTSPGRLQPMLLKVRDFGHPILGLAYFRDVKVYNNKIKPLSRKIQTISESQ